MKKTIKERVFNIAFAVLCLLVVILFYEKILIVTILLSVIAIVGLVKWKSKRTLGIFIIGAIVGSVAEMIAINFGVWRYSITNFYNIPFWLFILWGNAAAFIYQTAMNIREGRLEVK